MYLIYHFIYQISQELIANSILFVHLTASAANLPLLNPYENRNANFSNGINFAVAGATALPVQTLAVKNIFGARTNNSLDVQVSWMSQSLRNYCNTESGLLS